MSGERQICLVVLGGKHQPTGATRHYRRGELLGPPRELRIVQYEGDPGFYLLYYDRDGNEQTDTYHDTLEQAKAQAAFEFRVEDHDWQAADGDTVS